MGAIADLGTPFSEVVTANDNIVIKKHMDGYEGGRTLDLTDYKLTVINAGHVVIVEEATGTFKPMPLVSTNDNYDALPSGHSYAGIVVATKPISEPFVGILTNGTINPAAAPFKYDTILVALKAALPQIEFRKD